MFIREGARDNLMKDERELFLNEQWPDVVTTVRRLGLDFDDLLKRAKRQLADEGGEDK